MGKKDIGQEVKELMGDKEPLSVLRGLKEEEAYRLECEKFHFYEPNGKCEQFIKKIGEGEHFVVLFSAANGVGKTCAGANVVAHICFDSENQYFNYPLFKNWPYPKRGRIASDPTNIDKNLIPTLKEWLPEGRYKTKKGGKTYDSLWKTDNGWEFDIMTYDQDAKEYEGATLGWCIEENQRILLSNGIWKPIKDIKIGDEVLNTTDHFRKKKCKVVDVYDKGIKDLIKIKTRSGFELVCTPEHKIWVSNQGWIEARKLKVGNRLYSPYFEIEGKNTIKPNLAFMLGAWIGDGWFSKSLFIAIANRNFLNEVKKRVERISHKSKYDYRIVDKSLRNLIIKSELSDKKSGTKFIPELIFKEALFNQVEFLKGLYATDGWFSGSLVGYGTTSKRLAEDLRFLLNNIGIRAGIYFKKSQKVGVWNDQWFALITQKHNVKKFCELVQVDSKKEMQHRVYQEAIRRIGNTKGLERYKRDTRKSIVSVERIGKGKVYDISVEGEHSFICQGLRVSNCWFDEPPPEAIFKATVARMRKGGVIFISATPLKGSAWMYDHIISRPEKDLALKGQRCYIEADVEDACKQHGVRGHLEHDHILQMIAEYSEDEKQARVHGKFQHLVGLRFKSFSRNIHVIKPFEINLKDYCVYEALDTHPRVNDMATWIAVDRRGRKYIIDELWLKCQGGIEELAQRIKDKAQQYRVIRRLLEPAAFIEDQHTGKSLARSLAGYGLHYLQASKMRVQSDRRIEDALSFQQLGGSEEFIKTPEFYIFDICVRHIFEFEHYSWDDWTGKIAEKKGQKEKTIDKDDHSIENVGRILIQEPVFIPPAEKRQQDDDTNYDPFE